MKFCEECGAKLSEGARFCEQCGHEVALSEHSLNLSKDESLSEAFYYILPVSDFEKKLKFVKFNKCDFGIIITRENAIISQIDSSKSILHTLLNGFVANALKRNVCYYYLNLDDILPHNSNDSDLLLKDTLAFIRKISNVAKPKYLFILGDDSVVPTAKWENKSKDSDEFVTGDYCYTSLDESSPWGSIQNNVEDLIRVGRLPSFDSETFSQFENYFKNLENFSVSTVQHYALSALVWKAESDFEFKQVSTQNVDTSPSVTTSIVESRISPNSNLLYFNLHGSDKTKFWYGQDGGSYPEAFSPEVISKREVPYFLGVEACYGAKYGDGLSSKDSILLAAMSGKCLSFLGSSKIAYGTSIPNGSCADLIVGGYLKHISEGYSAGDAYVLGLKRLLTESKFVSDAEIKTLAEFSLYGDPSVRLTDNYKSLETTPSSKIQMPNIRRATQMAISEVDEKISKSIDDYVFSKIFKEISVRAEIEKSTYRMAGLGINQRIYSLRNSLFSSFAKVYFNDNGEILKSLISK